jgi:hypothetical protein
MGKRAKKIEWPVELRQPFPSFSQLTERARLLKPGGSLAEVIGVEFFAEVKRRVIAMVGFVDPLTEGPPATEREWLRFIFPCIAVSQVFRKQEEEKPVDQRSGPMKSDCSCSLM